MSKERNVAEQILQQIGGKENVSYVEHCATRLRLVLKDESKFDKKQIEAIDGVKGSFKAAGQYQIILGTGFVDKVYAEFMQLAAFENGELQGKAAATGEHMNWFQKASRLLGDVFLPIIPILVATGLFMGVRSLITNLGGELDPTVMTLSQVLIDTAFSFLPALVTYSVMKKFGGSPALGIVIGLMLVAPQLPNANQVAAGNVEPIYLALGGLSIPIVGYQGSVLPALVLGIIAAKIEKSLKKVVPDVLDLIVTPFVTLLCSMIIGLLVIGPVMHVVEQGLLIGVQAIMNIPFGVGGFVVGALQQVVVITGLHHTFKTLEIELLANTGANPFNTLTCGAIVAQCGAAVAAAPLPVRSYSRLSWHYRAPDLRRQPAPFDPVRLRLHWRRLRRCVLLHHGPGRYGHVDHGTPRHAALPQWPAAAVPYRLRHRLCRCLCTDDGLL